MRESLGPGTGRALKLLETPRARPASAATGAGFRFRWRAIIRAPTLGVGTSPVSETLPYGLGCLAPIPHGSFLESSHELRRARSPSWRTARRSAARSPAARRAATATQAPREGVKCRDATGGGGEPERTCVCAHMRKCARVRKCASARMCACVAGSRVGEELSQCNVQCLAWSSGGSRRARKLLRTYSRPVPRGPRRNLRPVAVSASHCSCCTSTAIRF